MENKTTKKLKKIEEWANDKLPNYVINLQKQLENQESAANAIIDKANKIKKYKDEIYRLVMININEELKKYLT